MKNFIRIILVLILLYNCTSAKKVSDSDARVPVEVKNDTIKIANEELEYEIIILEIGFDSWLITQRPITFYSKEVLEFKNMSNVIEWNIRVTNPNRYRTMLYDQMIYYDQFVDYGMEVNYLLYMYFKFFQEKYNQRLVYER